MRPVHNKLHGHPQNHQYSNHEDTYGRRVECDEPEESHERDGRYHHAESGHAR